MENKIEIVGSEDNDIEEQKIISLNRFIVLCLASFGLYPIWWIYKAWRFFQQKDNLNIVPATRTIFSIFFLNSLFNRIQNFAREKGYTENYSSVALCTGFIIVNLLAILPDPFWLISFFSFVFLIPPFRALNFAKQNTNHLIVTEQTAYSGRQIALMIIGVVFWLLGLIGMVLQNIF